MNELITRAVSDNKKGRKIIITNLCKNAIFDLLCFINLAK